MSGLKASCKRGIRLISFFIAIAFVVVALSSCSILLPREREVLSPPLADPPQPKYNLYKVARGDLEDQFTTAGIFVPVREYNISFGNNAGRLQEILVEPGDEVKKGDVLAKLDSEDNEHNLRQMKLDMEKSRLNYKKMMIDYEKLVADEEKARAQLDSARDQQARREAEERLEELVRQRQKFDIDLQIFNLNMEQQELNYQRTLERVERAEMRSPIDGIVNFSQRIAVGDWVNSYQNLFTVVDPSILYLCFQPTSFSKFQVGVKAEVTIDGQLYHGTIVMSPAATNMEITDERFRNTVVVEIEDLPEEVEAGDTASLKFIFNERKNVIIIPKSGLRNYGTRDYVVVRHDGVNREVDVEKGMETATYVEIISGLDEGAEIILR